MSDEKIPVVAAVISRDDRYLVARRPDHKRHGRRWEFPGGKLKPDESKDEGIRRELSEELRLEVVSVGETLFSADDKGAPFIIEFVKVAVQGIPELSEHSEMGWFGLDTLVLLPLAPADALFVEHLVSVRDERNSLKDQNS